jgi:uncharacterized SAM-binding protein YcdF (DUF218 family)
MYLLFVWTFLQPFALLCLLLGIVIALMWWKRRETRARLWSITATYLLLVAVCLPALSRLAIGSIEWQFPPLRERPSDVQAIVVLASYVEPPHTDWPRPELDVESLYRCEEAAEMYRQGSPCLIFISGGKPDADAPGPTCAAAMRDYLVKLGINPADMVVEERSRTTFENAVETGKLLNEHGIQRILLITKATHLLRGVGCFRKLGFDVVPCGCFYQAAEYCGSWVDLFVPNPAAARAMHQACHEWLGAAWYRLRGRM